MHGNGRGEDDEPAAYELPPHSSASGIRDAGDASRRPPLPGDEELFLTNIERILMEGSFVASYKYALLVALVELAIERGDDTGQALTLPIAAIADKFAESYWRQATPYLSLDGSGFVLHQSTGEQAAAIRMLTSLHSEYPTLNVAKASPRWQKLVRQIERLLVVMPLWRLQSTRTEKVDFLYRPGPTAGEITLLPGVAFHLRRRALLIRRLAQTEWLTFLLNLKQNKPALGDAVGLSEFLFGSERSPVRATFVAVLRDLQQGRCFYCGRGVARDAAVDHFIPWVRYPRDLAHNFVLAHATCNGKKSDSLASEEHLAHWTEFVGVHESSLAQSGETAGLFVNKSTSVAVAEWSYRSAERSGTLVWTGDDRRAPLTGSWRKNFATSDAL